jgi:hypothetical protein
MTCTIETVSALCANGLHEKSGPGRCVPCRKAKRARRYARERAKSTAAPRFDSEGHALPPVSGRCKYGRHEKDYVGECRACVREGRARRQRAYDASPKGRATAARYRARKAVSR